MTVDNAFSILKYLGNANSYLANLSPDQFNLMFPEAGLRFLENEYAVYGITKKNTDALSRVKTNPITITVDSNGQYIFPTDMLHEDSIMALYNGVQQEVTQFEGNRLANKLSSSIDPPSLEFPIYVRYSSYLQFYPVTLGSAILTYLKRPTAPFWAYTLNGTILSLGTLVGGTGYVNGTYTNVYLAGGSGKGMQVNITVAGGIVTVCTLVNGGVNYLTTDTLLVSNSFLGGTGSGFSITVATILANTPRPVYNPTNSVDPIWLDTDIYKIICLILGDYGINTRDQEVQRYAMEMEKVSA
jgi:hypothetical protein